MLDTDVCSYLMRDPTSFDDASLADLETLSDAFVSAVTRGELRFGRERKDKDAQLDTIVELFLASVTTLGWDSAAADRYGAVRADLERRGEPIGELDQMIAAHALSVGATLVTNNVRHFARVPDLDIRPWGLAT